MRKLIIALSAMACSLLCFGMNPQEARDSKTQIAGILNSFARKYSSARTIKVNSIDMNKKGVVVTASEELEDVPFREANVTELYQQIRPLFPDAKTVTVMTNGSAIEKLIPQYYSTGKADKSKLFDRKAPRYPLTSPAARIPQTKGLQERHIALWQSHGMYFSQSTDRWEWQRARLFGTVEDLYTQSYVLPFLVPMLENAGANVLIPRERDTHAEEIIIDNDGSTPGSSYDEQDGDKTWSDAGTAGFANNKPYYTEGENPFTSGTLRTVKSIRKGTPAEAHWTPDIPADGTYAVYVSYRTFPSSSDCVTYTVQHGGQRSSVNVNQTMCGGTWVYIGSYYFNKGKEGAVTLSNLSYKANKTISADGVKIGGGMGNIARSPKDSEQEAVVSNYPRFVEGARYWMQWAGFPGRIYSTTQFADDYKDDYQNRGQWVNCLKNEMKVPIDLSFAFHSDAGITPDDSIIGSLAIYTSRLKSGATTYSNKKSRETARDLADIVQTQIVNDVRRQFAPEWTRRGMWNQSYYEAWVPDVPAMLLELLSHQNFADMRYGLDPRFRFTVSRAIYKGILRYIGRQSDEEVVVSPLAPTRLYAVSAGESQAKIGWSATVDSMEPSATPDSYMLYTRIDNGSFDEGTPIDGTETTVTIRPDRIYSFKVVAVNEGGRSFPSEIVALCQNSKGRGTAMIVNGFDRLSAPASFELKADSMAGFRYDIDHGVPYMQDISFVGDQYVFQRKAPWVTNDDNGFGDCYNDYAGKVMAGNTFDFIYLHGKAMVAAGFSFVSASEQAVLEGKVRLGDYPVTDLILGKQRRTVIGNEHQPATFAAFPQALQEKLADYCRNGGSLMATGAYVLSDLQETPADRAFAKSILKCDLASSNASRQAEAVSCHSPQTEFSGSYRYCHVPQADIYCVERVNGLTPADKNAATVLRYKENNIGAAVAFDGAWRSFVMGFPFETIDGETERAQLMQSILTFFTSSKHQ